MQGSKKRVHAVALLLDRTDFSYLFIQKMFVTEHFFVYEKFGLGTSWPHSGKQKKVQ